MTPEHFRALGLYWDDGQIVEMLAVVGLFGFLNRWNETMATQIEGEAPSNRAGPVQQQLGSGQPRELSTPHGLDPC